MRVYASIQPHQQNVSLNLVGEKWCSRVALMYTYYKICTFFMFKVYFQLFPLELCVHILKFFSIGLLAYFSISECLLYIGESSHLSLIQAAKILCRFLVSLLTLLVAVLFYSFVLSHSCRIHTLQPHGL